MVIKKTRLLNAAEPKRRCKNWRHDHDDRTVSECFPCRWPEINKNLEINKNQRQNQSTGKQKQIKNSFETRNVSNTDNELHKWLIPKRTLPVKKFESIQKQTTLKNRYQDLFINDVNDSVEDTRENCFNELQKKNKNNVTTHRKPSVVVNELQDNDHGYQWKHSVPGTALY